MARKSTNGKNGPKATPDATVAQQPATAQQGELGNILQGVRKQVSAADGNPVLKVEAVQDKRDVIRNLAAALAVSQQVLLRISGAGRHALHELLAEFPDLKTNQDASALDVALKQQEAPQESGEMYKEFYDALAALSALQPAIDASLKGGVPATVAFDRLFTEEIFRDIATQFPAEVRSVRLLILAPDGEFGAAMEGLHQAFLAKGKAGEIAWLPSSQKSEAPLELVWQRIAGAIAGFRNISGEFDHESLAGVTGRYPDRDGYDRLMEGEYQTVVAGLNQQPGRVEVWIAQEMITFHGEWAKMPASHPAKAALKAAIQKGDHVLDVRVRDDATMQKLLAALNPRQELGSTWLGEANDPRSGKPVVIKGKVGRDVSVKIGDEPEAEGAPEAFSSVIEHLDPRFHIRPVTVS